MRVLRPLRQCSRERLYMRGHLADLMIMVKFPVFSLRIPAKLAIQGFSLHSSQSEPTAIDVG